MKLKRREKNGSTKRKRQPSGRVSYYFEYKNREKKRYIVTYTFAYAAGWVTWGTG